MPNQDSGSTQKKGFDWVFVFMCIALGAVVVYLVRRIRAVEKYIQKISKESEHTITQEDIGDAVKYYLETNPNYVTNICLPYIQKSPMQYHGMQPIRPQQPMYFPPHGNIPMIISPQGTYPTMQQPQGIIPMIPHARPPTQPYSQQTQMGFTQTHPVDALQREQHTKQNISLKVHHHEENGTSLEDFSEESQFEQPKEADAEVVCSGDLCFIMEKKNVESPPKNSITKIESPEEKPKPKEQPIDDLFLRNNTQNEDEKWKNMEIIHDRDDNPPEDTVPVSNLVGLTGDAQLDNMVNSTLSALLGKIREKNTATIQFSTMTMVDFSNPALQEEIGKDSKPIIEELSNDDTDEQIVEEKVSSVVISDDSKREDENLEQSQ